ncbi:MAG: hypothetical protein N2559_13885 [Anaerolineae bacterium]|nr:hypothetical protein [Anaerolineae bacterium]
MFALFFSLQALSSFYYAFLAGFAVVLYVLWFLSTQYALRTTHHASRNTHYTSPSHCPTVPLSHCPTALLLARLTFATTLIALFIVPFFAPYLQVQREMGFERAVTESEPFSASLKLYTEVSPQNVLYGNWLAPRPPIMLGGYPLDNLFPGILALVLASIGILANRYHERWFYLLLLTFAFLLSLGPRLYLAPNVPTDITLPYRWLYDAFPLLRALRAPVRFDALVMFALAILAGFGVSRFTFHVSGFTPHASRFTLHTSRSTLSRSLASRLTFHVSSFKFQVLPFLLTLLIALEYLALPAARITPMPVGDTLPEYVRWLRAQPRSVILELPMIASDPTKPLDLTTQYLSTYHWHTTPDGYSGFNPPRRGEIAYEMQWFPSERALALLHALDVQYVVYHKPPSPYPVDWWVDDLEFIQQWGNDYFYRVRTRPRDNRLEARVFLPQPAAPNHDYIAYVIIHNRGARSFAIKPNESLRVLARWNDAAPIEVKATMPLVTSSVSIVPIRLRAPAQVGMHRLRLETCPEQRRRVGEWRLEGEVSVVNDEPARVVVLPARVTLAAPLASSYAPGDTVNIALLWHALNKIDAYYSASVRIVDAQGNKIVAQDRQPSVPTLLWRPNSHIPDRFELTLPDDLPRGEYTIQVKMYQADQGVDALLFDADDNLVEQIVIARLVVR